MYRRFSLLGRDLAVDYGTSRLRVLVPGTGPVFDAPSAVTYHTRTGRILAYGDEAMRMYGRTPPGVQTVRPLKEGAVADFEIARWLLSQALAAASGSSRLSRPRVALVTPQGASDLVRQALADTAIQAGARDVQLVDSCLAAAIGAGLPIDEPRGTMLVDVGAGTSEIAILALGEVLQAHSARVAGDAFDTAVAEHFRRAHGIGLSRTAAEALKIQVGLVPPENTTVRLNGRHLRSGLPVTRDLPSEEVATALRRPVRSLLDTIGKALDACPAELAQDLTERGIYLTGCGALLRGLAAEVREATGIPVRGVEAPGEATARGAVEFAANFKRDNRAAYAI